MIAGGSRRIAELVVVGAGEGLCTPCGACRQRIREFAGQECPIHIAGPEGIRASFTLSTLLPIPSARESRQRSLMMEALSIIQRAAGMEPVEAGIVLGSGLGQLGEKVTGAVSVPYEALPGFPKGGVSGHQSRLIIGQLGGRRVAVFSGREHYYEHGNSAAMRPALETLKALGASTLILTNAAGSLRSEVGRPRSSCIRIT